MRMRISRGHGTRTISGFVSRITKCRDRHSMKSYWCYIDESQEKVEVRYRSLDDTSWLSIAQESDGLSGELYGDNGWVAKYSKYDQFSD